jgi:3-hydroxyisobutyrate dehydrogenase
MSERVGFIGLGSIGRPMAQRLQDVGTPLTVANRTASKADALRQKGAGWAATPAELASSADVIMSCLEGPEADRAVFLGDDGLLSVDLSGKHGLQ